MTTQAVADTDSRASQLVNGFLEIVKKGKEGKNLGIPISLWNVDRYLHGVQRSRYYLIGADSGVGKTTLANFIFLLELWREAKKSGKKFRVIYYSFEISAQEQIAGWCSYFVSTLYDVSLPTDYVLGYIQGNTISDEHLELVEGALKVIEEMLGFVTIHDTAKNPTAIFHDMVDLAEELGTVHREEKINKRVLDKNGKPTKQSYITGFTSDDPDLDVYILMDHIALCMPEAGLTAKATIDRMSSYFVFARNKFRFSMVIIQQFNTEMQTVERRKFSQAAFAPQRGDFGDSKYTFRDADVVIGLIKPVLFDLKTYFGYPVIPGGDLLIGLEDCFVMAFLMKNRYGPANKPMPLFMDGVTKRFYDLPVDPIKGVMELEGFAIENDKIKQICQLYSQPRKA